jgi:hypothetical protein
MSRHRSCRKRSVTHRHAAGFAVDLRASSLVIDHLLALSRAVAAHFEALVGVRIVRRGRDRYGREQTSRLALSHSAASAEVTVRTEFGCDPVRGLLPPITRPVPSESVCTWKSTHHSDRYRQFPRISRGAVVISLTAASPPILIVRPAKLDVYAVISARLVASDDRLVCRPIVVCERPARVVRGPSREQRG